jgi:hypothetical protein
MRQYLEIGPTPCDEDCQQVGTASYNGARARIECQAFANQLLRQFGEPPQGARIGIKSFPHDFGSYSEVVVYYDDAIPESEAYAFRVESESPANWDGIARKELSDWDRLDSMVS